TVPGGDSSGRLAAYSEAFGAPIILEMSPKEPEYSSAHWSPLDMCNRSAIVIAWRGSCGSAHAFTGAGSPRWSLPSSTRRPITAEVKLFAIDADIIDVSGPSGARYAS